MLRVCSEAAVPVTVAAGRSGVCGASIPVHGGVVLDLCGLEGIVDVDRHVDGRRRARRHLRRRVRGHAARRARLTCGHWPQSIALSTVGGWLACRGAGQLSTRYGKIEDIVTGLDVVLADGRMIHTGGAPRAAVGPDLTQLFVGSEGTLGVITGARLRVASGAAGASAAPRTASRRSPTGSTRAGASCSAARRPRCSGCTTASRPTAATRPATCAVLLVLDEADAALVGRDDGDRRRGVRGAPSRSTTACSTGGSSTATTSPRSRRSPGGASSSTRWRSPGAGATCRAIYERTRDAILGVDGAMVASAHQSHSYLDGACLYFTFAGNPGDEPPDVFYRAAWDAGTRAVLAEGGALSHHHGVGLNRARFVRDALGDAFDVLVAVKHALDPQGILNPGKLGLPDPWGGPAWP